MLMVLMMPDHYLQIFQREKLRAKYNDTSQVNENKELCTTFNCKGLNQVVCYHLIQQLNYQILNMIKIVLKLN